MNPTALDPDDAALRALLAESGLADDPALLDVLAEFRDLGAGPAPEPDEELAALLVAPPASGRHRFGRRGAGVVALVSVITLGSALSAAASPQVRAQAQSVVASVVQAVAPQLVSGATHPRPRPDAVAAHVTHHPSATVPTGAAGSAVTSVPAPHPTAGAPAEVAATGVDRSDGATGSTDRGEGGARGKSDTVPTVAPTTGSTPGDAGGDPADDTHGSSGKGHRGGSDDQGGD